MARGEKKTGMIAVRLEPEIIASIEREADKEDRPVAAMTRILLKEAIATREAKKPNRRTK